MKIAIYSGSFDPIHTGHAMVANYAAQWGGVDEVWLMVSRRNPLKTDREPTDDNHRLAMAGIVAGKCKGVRVSDFEMHLPYPSYTYVTLCRLREEWPMHDFTLIIGSDNWIEFPRWRDYDKIIEEFGLLIYPRPGWEISGNLPSGVRVLEEGPTAFISSTFVRGAIAEGRDVDYFVPTEVATYIKEHGLYR